MAKSSFPENMFLNAFLQIIFLDNLTYRAYNFMRLPGFRVKHVREKCIREKLVMPS